MPLKAGFAEIDITPPAGTKKGGWMEDLEAKTFPKHSFVVGGANGMIGYVPTKDAFARGGYETTLGPPSRMAPETGDLLADAAIKLIKNMKG